MELHEQRMMRHVMMDKMELIQMDVTMRVC